MAEILTGEAIACFFCLTQLLHSKLDDNCDRLARSDGYSLIEALSNNP
ncbi:hypothetical protein [Merismopedia glauca]|nr:hypothetical protein [Merismopedia glauca]